MASNLRIYQYKRTPVSFAKRARKSHSSVWQHLIVAWTMDIWRDLIIDQKIASVNGGNDWLFYALVSFKKHFKTLFIFVGSKPVLKDRLNWSQAVKVESPLVFFYVKIILQSPAPQWQVSLQTTRNKWWFPQTARFFNVANLHFNFHCWFLWVPGCHSMPPRQERRIRGKHGSNHEKQYTLSHINNANIDVEKYQVRNRIITVIAKLSGNYRFHVL